VERKELPLSYHMELEIVLLELGMSGGSLTEREQLLPIMSLKLLTDIYRIAWIMLNADFAVLRTLSLLG